MNKLITILTSITIAASAFGQQSPMHFVQGTLVPEQTPIIPASPSPTPKLLPAYDGQKIISLAENELGVYKIPGNDDPRVRQYATDTLQNDDNYTNDGWCSAFVSFILKEGGYQYSPNNTDYGWGFVIHRVDAPKPGDIAMLDSHIAFFIGQKVNAEGQIVVGLLGGNQDYQVCIMWVPAMDIEYYAEAEPAGSDWKPTKHIPNGMGASSGLNILDDHIKFSGHSLPNCTVTRGGHPL
jgi:uncharacterized protein (TIGR02594 family)